MGLCLNLVKIARQGDPEATEAARRRYVEMLRHTMVGDRMAMGASREDLEEEERLQRLCDEATATEANPQTEGASQANLQAASDSDTKTWDSDSDNARPRQRPSFGE